MGAIAKAPVKSRAAYEPSAQLEPLLGCSPTNIWRQVRTEHISFWFACGYLFMEYVRPQTIYPAIDVLPWTQMFVIGAIITSFFDRRQPRASSPLTALILLYGFIVLLSAVFAEYRALALGMLDTFYLWVIIYFAIVRTVVTRERFFIFLLLYMLANFKMSQHGFLSWARKGFRFDDWGTAGAPGWFENSGEFGIQLCIFLPMAVAFVYAVRHRLSRFWSYVAMFAPFSALASVVATSSRGAMLGVAASGLWALKTTRHFWRTLVVIVLIGATAYLVTPAEFKHRFDTAGEDRTSQHRLDRWKQGWETMLDHPLLGIGHENWPKYFVEHRDTTTEPGTPLVHNFFVQCGIDLGFTGLLVLIALLITMFRLTSRIRAMCPGKDEQSRFFFLMANGMDGATIGLIVSGSFVTVLYYPYIWIHAAFVTAMYGAVCSGRDKSRSPTALTTRERPI